LNTEKHTRKQIIDTRLKKAGWNVADRTQVIEEFDIIVDKTLFRKRPNPMGVISSAVMKYWRGVIINMIKQIFHFTQ
jgi:type I site-specific restriction endonuclease